MLQTAIDLYTSNVYELSVYPTSLCRSVRTVPNRSNMMNILLKKPSLVTPSGNFLQFEPSYRTKEFVISDKFNFIINKGDWVKIQFTDEIPCKVVSVVNVGEFISGAE